LPEKLKESLRIHKGQTGNSQWLVAGWELLSTQRVLVEWKVWIDLYDKESFKDWDFEPQEGVANVWWQPKWVPLTYLLDFDAYGKSHFIKRKISFVAIKTLFSPYFQSHL
jgi:cell wall assembly regulator SMI1